MHKIYFKATIYILIFLSVILLVFTVFSVGVYQMGWTGNFVDKVLQTLPFPAAVVNNSFITISELEDRVDAYVNSVQYGSEYDFDSPEGKTFLATQRSQILDSLIEQELFYDLARVYGVNITRSEIDQHYRFLLSEFGFDESEADKIFPQLFGWDESGFIDNIAKPNLLNSKVKIAYLSTRGANESQQKIQKAKDALADENAFAEVASQYSEDEQSRIVGGDIGFFEIKALPVWFSEIADYEVGQISDVIVSPDGYHIFKVNFRSSDEDQSGIQIAHIFVRDPSFADFFEQYKDQAKIYRVTPPTK